MDADANPDLCSSGPRRRDGAGGSAQVLVADWSGARTGEERTLRLAALDGPDRRVTTVSACTRTQAEAGILAAVDRQPDTVVGLDFSFSLPAWWLAACGIADVAELWADAARLEDWLARCDPPFWGRPGRRRPPDQDGWRRTELCLSPRPSSTFQIGGAGAVGTASLRGMPHLARLRAAGCNVWPWDPWQPPVVAEVWPRLAIGRLVKSSATARAAWAVEHTADLAEEAADEVRRSPDALDAAAAAIYLAALRPPDPPALPEVALEGWIVGA